MAINAGAESFPGRELSNFPPASFTIDGVECASAEGFIQALKEPDPEKQVGICALVGRKAKFKGKKVWKKHRHKGKVWWQGREIEFRSKEHMELVERALRAKFAEHEPSRIALLATGDEEITHDLGRPESPYTSLPAAEFVRMLTSIRAELRAAA